MKVEINSKRWIDLRDLRGEVWRVIEDTPENGTYLISNYGRLKRLAFFGGRYHFPDMVLRAHRNRKDGYYKVRVGKTMHYVHRLVAIAFLAPKPGCKYVDHRNGDKTDCRARNLRWVTAKQNARNPVTRWDAMNRKGRAEGDRPIPIRTQISLKKYNPEICLSRGYLKKSLPDNRSTACSFEIRRYLSNAEMLLCPDANMQSRTGTPER